MGQKHIISPHFSSLSDDFLSICTKIELDFLQNACEWIGKQFQAEEVSLCAIFAESHFFNRSREPLSRNEIIRWSHLNSSEKKPAFSEPEINILPLVAHNSGDVVISENKLSGEVNLKAGAKEVESNESNSFQQTLKVPTTTSWSHETYFVLRGYKIAPPATCSQNAQAEKTPLSTVLQRTAIELSSFITSQQKEEQIAAYHTVISSISVPIFTKDNDLRYSMINDAFCNCTKKTRSEVLGKTDTEIFRDQLAKQSEVVGQRVLSGETVRQEKMIDYSGSMKSVRTINSPVRNEMGDVIGLCGICHDITDLKDYESQLKQANSFQQAIIRTAAEGICVCVPTTQPPYLRFTIWNERLTQITGYTLIEINHFNWLAQVLHEKFGAEYVQHRFRQLTNGMQFQEEEFEIICKNGERKNILFSSSQVANGKQKNAIVILTHDITARTRFQESLKESQSRYSLATRNANISVWEWNLQTGCVIDDGNLARILGYPEYEMKSIDAWREKVHPDDKIQVQERCEAFIKRETRQLILEKRMRHARGHWVWIATQGQYASNDENSKIAIGTDLDITKQKEDAERLANTQEELLHITRLSTVGEIAASLAHDITQPVTAICNYAAAANHLLEMPEQEGSHLTAAGYLKKIEQNSKVATNILKGVRSYINTGNCDRATYCLGEIIDGAMEFSYSEIRRRNIQLVRKSNADDILVSCDRAQLIHVLMNVLNNAIDAIALNRNKPPVITVTSSADKNNGEISIQDNGIGFNNEKAVSIFKPFTSTKTGGMGIGLAICKTLIEANSGSINAEGFPKTGAIFRITIPRNRTPT